MPSYPIYCYTDECKNLAQYKIAARWSDGVVSELKTYGLCCEDCLATWFARGRESHRKCRLIPGETLEEPGIYRLERGQRDQTLTRVAELESGLSGPKAKAE
ncbi:MAG: hypothetical protein FJ303_06615 [Planctomycetes bacterium]|nr:hypothetical protein [Planctomycetota bacterium]